MVQISRVIHREGDPGKEPLLPLLVQKSQSHLQILVASLLGNVKWAALRGRIKAMLQNHSEAWALHTFFNNLSLTIRHGNISIFGNVWLRIFKVNNVCFYAFFQWIIYSLFFFFKWWYLQFTFEPNFLLCQWFCSWFKWTEYLVAAAWGQELWII